MEHRPIRIADADILRIQIEPGQTAHIRRSSLIVADGPFDMKTVKIAKRRFSIIGLFSGQEMWANTFTAQDAPVSIIAGRDFNGRIIGVDVTPDTSVHLQPGLYLGHVGDLEFNTRRVAKKEFWTLTEVVGTGTVYIKVQGRPTVLDLNDHGAVVDTDYVAIIRGEFDAYGKVFKKSELVKSGELSNVRLTGTGQYVVQSQNPEESQSGGGGIISQILDWLPF